MNKFNFLSIVCAFMILNIAPNVTASQDALTVAQKLDEDARHAEKSVPFLTIATITEKPEIFKQAWETLLESLVDAQKNLDAYKKIAETPASKKVMEKANSKILNIQDTVVNFFTQVENEIEKNTVTYQTKRKLLNIYATLTENWVENPLGTKGVEYKKIIEELVRMVQADEPHIAPGGPAIPAAADTPTDHKAVAEQPQRYQTGGPLYLAPRKPVAVIKDAKIGAE